MSGRGSGAVPARVAGIAPRVHHRAFAVHVHILSAIWSKIANVEIKSGSVVLRGTANTHGTTDADVDDFCKFFSFFSLFFFYFRLFRFE